MPVNHSLAAEPKASTMLLLTVIQLRKKKRSSSTSGRDHGSGWRCALRAPSFPLVMLRKQLGVCYTRAASCRYVCGTLRTSTDETESESVYAVINKWTVDGRRQESRDCFDLTVRERHGKKSLRGRATTQVCDSDTEIIFLDKSPAPCVDHTALTPGAGICRAPLIESSRHKMFQQEKKLVFVIKNRLFILPVLTTSLYPVESLTY